MSLSLRPYQEETAAHLLSAHHEPRPADRVRLDLSDPGLGKTVVAAAALGRREQVETIMRGRPGCTEVSDRPAIVICPASVRDVWRRELALWAPGLYPVFPADTFSIRRPGPGEVLVLGHDQIGSMRPPPPPRSGATEGALRRHQHRLELHARRETALRSLADCLPGTDLVVDEAHYQKGAASARSLEVERLWKESVRPRGGALWLLTGTIDPCSPLDLWVVLEVAGVSKQIFPGGITDCLERHFGGRYDKRSARWAFPALPPGGSVLQGEVGRRATRFLLRRQQEEVLGELPPPVSVVTLCPVEGSLRSELDDFLRAAVACSGADPDQRAGDVLEALSGRQARRGRGGLDLGAVSETRAKLAAVKVPVVMSRLRALRKLGIGVPGDPVVLCSEHLAAVDAVRLDQHGPIRGAAWAGSELGYPWGFVTGAEDQATRSAAVADLAAGKLAGLAMTRAGQEGISLVASRYMLKASMSWSADDERQRERRLLRFGQGRTVTIEAVVADHPVERMLLRVLRDKSDRTAATWAPPTAVAGETP